jgi:hypothetical protein
VAYDIGADETGLTLITNGGNTTAGVMVTLPTGQSGMPYTTAITASYGTAPYTFTVTSGAVPTGLTLNPDGTWSGSPTAFGTFSFTVQVTDSAPFNSPTATTDSQAFQLNVLGPTASGVSLSGRVLTSDGRPIRFARLTLNSFNNGETLETQTDEFGNFIFDDNVEPGSTYSLTVAHPRYQFGVATRVVSVSGDLEGIIFVADKRTTRTGAPEKP